MRVARAGRTDGVNRESGKIKAWPQRKGRSVPVEKAVGALPRSRCSSKSAAPTAEIQHVFAPTTFEHASDSSSIEHIRSVCDELGSPLSKWGDGGKPVPGGRPSAELLLPSEAAPGRLLIVGQEVASVAKEVARDLIHGAHRATWAEGGQDRTIGGARQPPCSRRIASFTGVSKMPGVSGCAFRPS